jgi:hypothetical protein
MPQRTVYIRTDDLPLWEALENKAEAISAMLRGSNITPVIGKERLNTVEKNHVEATPEPVIVADINWCTFHDCHPEACAGEEHPDAS